MSNQDDAIYVDIRKPKHPKEIDLDELFNIGLIKQIIFVTQTKAFYIIANRYDEMLGFFVLKFLEHDPNQKKFLMRDKNKLDIGDADMFINYRSKDSRELIISYKSIYINTYTISVLDLWEDSDKALLFRHEIFQLWESEIQGLLLQEAKDFISINKDGIHVIALGSTSRRPLVDGDGNDRMIHSLESMSFLKLDP